MQSESPEILNKKEGENKTPYPNWEFRTFWMALLKLDLLYATKNIYWNLGLVKTGMHKAVALILF